MEMPDDPSILEATFKMIKAETQLVWSSDYPHWDFDAPGEVMTPYHPLDRRRRILGENASKLYGIKLKPDSGILAHPQALAAE
jgi:predicted TIM-barrel fold metal-dependent hydrolase